MQSVAIKISESEHKKLKLITKRLKEKHGEKIGIGDLVYKLFSIAMDALDGNTEEKLVLSLITDKEIEEKNIKMILEKIEETLDSQNNNIDYSKIIRDLALLLNIKKVLKEINLNDIETIEENKRKTKVKTMKKETYNKENNSQLKETKEITEKEGENMSD
jgi:DNA-binding LytR/AlgR family response regulator